MPLLTNYIPEVDGSSVLDERGAAFYQSLIGIFLWMVEIGCLGIFMDVSAMSSFIAMPIEGYFQQLMQLFAYLKIHHKARIVFDPSYPEIDEEYFK